MDTDFSLKRVGLLLRKDWIEYKRRIAYTALTVFAIVAILLILSAIKDINSFHPLVFYGFGLLGTWIGICRYSGGVVHQSKGIYLTLPASSEEKFVTLLVEAALWLVLFQVTFWSCIGIGSLFIPVKPISIHDLTVDIHTLSSLSFIASLLFLSYVTFRKFALGIAVGGFVLALSAIAWIIYLSRDILFPDSGCLYYDTESPFFTTLSWLAHGFMPAFLIATLVVLYVAYLKLKEKELR